MLEPRLPDETESQTWEGLSAFCSGDLLGGLSTTCAEGWGGALTTSTLSYDFLEVSGTLEDGTGSGTGTLTSLVVSATSVPTAMSLRLPDTNLIAEMAPVSPCSSKSVSTAYYICNASLMISLFT